MTAASLTCDGSGDKRCTSHGTYHWPAPISTAARDFLDSLPDVDEDEDQVYKHARRDSAARFAKENP